MVKGLGPSQTLHAGRVGDLLIGDHARDGSDDVDDAGGMILVDAEKLQLLGGGIQIDLGVLCGVFGLLQERSWRWRPCRRESVRVRVAGAPAALVLGFEIFW